MKVFKMVMMLYSYSVRLYVLITLCCVCLSPIWANQLDNKTSSLESFSKSFINSYDLSGKYTHEYHPFILAKTQQSFLELEAAIKKLDISVDGHIGILGYQEEAVSPYKTDWQRTMLTDEAIVKTEAGIVEPAKNIFGFMTAFLLKDAEWLEQRWKRSYVKDKRDAVEQDDASPSVHHIAAHDIELFDDDAYIFQKHAFGEDFDQLLAFRRRIEYALSKGNLKKILSELGAIWSNMYTNASTNDIRQAISSQDINFSINYAQALASSKVHLKKLYLGPDITYPIEVLQCQNALTTRHAQKFVSVVNNDLQAIDQEPTAYIFCSFVDGVGKSTLLQNIKNYQNYHTVYDLYERSDNSSSQKAEVYCLKDNVYLVDLPAQMSHFAIKPAGHVFVDMQATQLSDDDQQQLMQFIKANQVAIEAEFTDILKKQQNMLKVSQAYLYPDIELPAIEQYARNCVVLYNEQPAWIAGTYYNYTFIFDKYNSSSIRILMPLDQVHSYGLKIVEPEQMIFDYGLALPMNYQSFLADLQQKLQQVGIKHAMFINFLSMYPRTSRETVRVNFILQYLKQLYGDAYDMRSSAYSNMVYKEQEICYLLQTNQQVLGDALLSETALRWSLFDLLDSNLQQSVSYLQGSCLEQFLQEQIHRYNAQYMSNAASMIRHRFDIEALSYKEKYELDKIYQTLIASDDYLVEFSNFLATLFQTHISSQVLNKLWREMDGAITATKPASVILNNQVVATMQARYACHNKQKNNIGPIRRMIRAQWYATLTNLLHGVYTGQHVEINNMHIAVPPLIVRSIKKQADNIDRVVLQKELEIIDERYITSNQLAPLLQFHVANMPENKPISWGKFEHGNHAYCLDWYKNFGTCFGLYAFGYFPLENGNTITWPKSDIITQLVHDYKIDQLLQDKTNVVMTTTELYRHIIQKGRLNAIKQEIEKHVVQAEHIDIHDPRIEAIRLYVLSIATLEMILKDPDSDIVVRQYNKEDFIACVKLIELVTLPLYTGLKLEGPLFDDYTRIEPVIALNRHLST